MARKLYLKDLDGHHQAKKSLKRVLRCAFTVEKMERVALTITSGGWTVTTAVGAVIQAQREKKHQLKLRVDGEESLGICTICRCPLFLKVFYDWDTVYGHTTDDKFREFREKWPACWMVKELDQHTKSK